MRRETRNRPTNPFEIDRSARQRTTGAFLVDQIDRTGAVDVDEITIEVFFQQLNCSRHRVDEGTAKLNAEDRFGRMSTKQREFGHLTLEQRRGHRHFSTGDFTAEIFAHASKRKISHRRQRRQIKSTIEIDLHFFSRLQTNQIGIGDRAQRSIRNWTRRYTDLLVNDRLKDKR